MEIEEKKTEDDDHCMICRSSDTDHSEMCYLAELKYSNMLNLQLGEKNSGVLFFTTCEHAAHFKCCLKAFGRQERFKCPLCKAGCNIMLPVSECSNP